jgi:phage baseplate assembly protein W
MAITTRQNDYRDLDLDFIAHPITGDVVAKSGPDAIARSIRNLVLTNFYDRPFRSNIGSNVQKLLFENFTSITIRNLEESIKDVITGFEPRANVLGVKAEPDIDNNGVNVKIAFAVNNRTEVFATTIFLERIR